MIQSDVTNEKPSRTLPVGGVIARRFPVLCLGIAALAVGTLLAVAPQAIPHLWPIGASYAAGVIGLLCIVVLADFVFLRIVRLRRSRTDGNPVMSYLGGLAGLDIFVGFSSLVIVVTVMTVFKTSVVGAQGYHLDATFIAADRAIFGTDPWILTHAFLSDARITRWLDILYHAAFLPMVLGYILCLGLRTRSALRHTYMASYLAAWVIIGMWMASAMASAGPVYDGSLFGDGTTFKPLIERLAQLDTQAGPFSSTRIQQYLLIIRENGSVGIGGGISAMPSMHVVLAALCMFAGWHLNRGIGVATTLYAAVIWMTSVHLGWHYFVDGLVSLVVLGVIWAVVGRLVGLYGCGPMAPRTPPV